MESTLVLMTDAPAAADALFRGTTTEEFLAPTVPCQTCPLNISNRFAHTRMMDTFSEVAGAGGWSEQKRGPLLPYTRNRRLERAVNQQRMLT